MSWIIGAITLPSAPHKITVTGARSVLHFPVPRGFPIIVDIGKFPEKVRIEGMTATEAQYYSTLLPLNEQKENGDEVIRVVAPQDYGGFYYQLKFEYTEEGGSPWVFRYNLELMKEGRTGSGSFKYSRRAKPEAVANDWE